jgi:hypothetical protein
VRFFSLFFKKLSIRNPTSKLFHANAHGTHATHTHATSRAAGYKVHTMHPLEAAEGGHFLHNLIPILLNGATSVASVERFVEMYSNVGLSECKHHTYIHVYMYICIYVYMYICISVYLYICISVYLYICTHTHLNTCATTLPLTHSHPHPLPPPPPPLTPTYTHLLH